LPSVPRSLSSPPAPPAGAPAPERTSTTWTRAGRRNLTVALLYEAVGKLPLQKPLTSTDQAAQNALLAESSLSKAHAADPTLAAAISAFGSAQAKHDTPATGKALQSIEDACNSMHLGVTGVGGAG
jgi:hypothetical protein